MNDAFESFLEKIPLMQKFLDYRRERRKKRHDISREKRYRYYKGLRPDEYAKDLKRWYKNRTGKILNLENPQTFNEKIQWLKLYDATPLKTRLADKYLVRDWVAEKIGAEYLIPLLGVYDKFDDIDFDKLPDKFVMKANHGSGWNIIVTDKTKLNIAEAKKKFDFWMSHNYTFVSGLELHYKNIVPKIIIEEYLENSDNDLYDYKFMCFDGKVHHIQFMTDRKNLAKMTIYDTDWNRLPFAKDHPRHEKDIEKPTNLGRMIKLAETLAAGFSHVRVDFYSLNDGTVKFSEMTFTPASGIGKWNPPQYDKIIGDLINLPEKSEMPK